MDKHHRIQKIRSATASALFDSGAPLAAIIAKCKWSTGSTFFKNYYRRNPNISQAVFRENRAKSRGSASVKPLRTGKPENLSVINSFTKKNPPRAIEQSFSSVNTPQPGRVVPAYIPYNNSI